MKGRPSPLSGRQLISQALESSERRRFPPAVAIGFTLAEDVTLDRARPPTPLSAMDGFAVRSEEVPAELRLSGTARPGDPPPGPLQSGQAMRTLTGAPVPEGADAVVMQEDVTSTGERFRIPAVRSGANIVPAGKAVEAGTVVPAGTKVGPGLAETLASQGIDEVDVRALPRIRLAPLGDELVSGRIQETVCPILEQLLAAVGASVDRLDPVGDDPQTLRKVLGGPEPVTITTGGTGPSIRDPARRVEVDELLFEGLNVKPGKPLRAAVLEDDGLWIALPGNPTSAIFTFRAIVLPSLLHASGHASGPRRRARHRVAEPLEPHPKKWLIAPVRIEEDGVHPISQGPSLATGWWLDADGLVLLMPSTRIEEDALVEVMHW